MPADFRDATIVALFKNKGSRADCGNHRGISLLSTAGKIRAHIMLNRLIPSVAEKNLPESQCGFLRNHSTTDTIFTVRQIQEKCTEQKICFYAVFIDLTKHLTRSMEKRCGSSLGNLAAQGNSPPSSDCFMMT